MPEGKIKGAILTDNLLKNNLIQGGDRAGAGVEVYVIAFSLYR